MSFQAQVLTLFPELFPGSLGASLAGRALARGLFGIETVDLRSFGQGPHRRVDDTPFGGGAGMVISADVIDQALGQADDARPLLFMTPRGRRLTQADCVRFAKGPGLRIVCGRYEGIDQRVIDARGGEEISIGDYVLSGGEPAALVVLDAVVRLLPGVMGAAESADEESFTAGLLEYPHYTRPAVWQGMAVPPVLLSGDHGAVARWRREQAEDITRTRRPDLWAAYVAGKTPTPTTSMMMQKG